MPSKVLYGNIKVVGPGSDEIMFRTNWERAEWYLRFGLAVLEKPEVLRLNFKPRGPGHAGDPYFLQEFKNQCVVCGITEDLSHHHIVPDCYRKYFQRTTRDAFGRWMYDVLLLCVGCHHRYEDLAWELKTVIAKEYEVHIGGASNLDKPMLRAIKAAAALDKHAYRMPKERCDELKADLRIQFGFDPDPSDYRKIWKDLIRAVERTPMGKLVAEKLVDVDAFAIRWRQHFVKTMKPAHLPQGWDTERKIYV